MVELDAQLGLIFLFHDGKELNSLVYIHFFSLPFTGSFKCSNVM